jgi:hypothetical protein
VRGRNDDGRGGRHDRSSSGTNAVAGRGHSPALGASVRLRLQAHGIESCIQARMHASTAIRAASGMTSPACMCGCNADDRGGGPRLNLAWITCMQRIDDADARAPRAHDSHAESPLVSCAQRRAWRSVKPSISLVRCTYTDCVPLSACSACSTVALHVACSLGVFLSTIKQHKANRLPNNIMAHTLRPWYIFSMVIVICTAFYL